MSWVLRVGGMACDESIQAELEVHMILAEECGSILRIESESLVCSLINLQPWY